MKIGKELAELTAGIDALYRNTPRSDGFLDKEGLIPVAMATVEPAPLRDYAEARARLEALQARLPTESERALRADYVGEMIDSLLALVTTFEEKPISFADRVARQIRVPTQLVPDSELEGYRTTIREKLDELGYSGGSLTDDFNRWEAQARVPVNSVLEVLRTLISEGRNRVTATMYPMAHEWMEPEGVSAVPFSAYCDYATGQASVMLVCIAHLLRHRTPGIGTYIALVAFGVAMLGQFMVIGSNWAVLVGALEYDIYYALASYALLCTVFSGTVWNLGFAMMTIDGLQQRLRHLSETDELTGLANRRAFRRRLESVHRHSAEEGEGYSVVLIDLNDFKPLNDRLGHAAGDEALVGFARLLRSSVRSTDTVARLGGDEFCILLPGTNADEANRIAASVRKRVEATPIVLSGRTVTLSASIGVATEGEARAVGADLVSMADRRLYRDKAKHKAAFAISLQQAAPAS
ncbi:MAG: hypothetical protein ABS75_20625 [Pelagibacterium sp. SCN 63-23]|nr:MAG: hypothetical protein ABS75_20625 [Pelagibacterium sp. SCN 63-23]